jgi:uncharacterized glyoxalase superfamily protein PhnB
MKQNIITPFLNVRDVKYMVDFYHRAFDFKFNDNFCYNFIPESLVNLIYNDIVIVYLAQEDSLVGTGKSPATLGVQSSIVNYVYCDDVDVLYEKAVGQGAVSLSVPHDTFWGDRVCSFQDPDGYEWMFAVDGGEKNK